MNRDRIRRKIERARKKLEPLIERKAYLSEHGHWEIGFLQGQISILEDWLDDITENVVATQDEKDYDEIKPFFHD